jgi:citrate synthase
MTPWRTAIAQTDETSIRLRGYDIVSLMDQVTFPGVVFLLHQGRLPTADEARLLGAILIGVADHGAGAPSCATARLALSGNRSALSAAVAAGLLAVGDEHGGAGAACMDLIGETIARAKREQRSLAEAAAAVVDESRAAGQRLPGLGHRQHSKDPRVDFLFNMARGMGLAKDGVEAILAIEAAARERIKPLPMNIDGALAGILYDLGFPSAAGKFIFMVGRVAGLTAEVAEELTREKAMRIRIPVEYDGEPARQIP